MDGEGCFEKLFWCDRASSVDFETFGQVLVFDTTYRFNVYNKPLVVFVGINYNQKALAPTSNALSLYHQCTLKRLCLLIVIKKSSPVHKAFPGPCVCGLRRAPGCPFNYNKKAEPFLCTLVVQAQCLQ